MYLLHNTFYSKSLQLELGESHCSYAIVSTKNNFPWFRFPSLSAKILPLMKDFLIALRAKDDTPAPLRDFTKEAESGILDSFKTEEIAKQQMITTKQLGKV